MTTAAPPLDASFPSAHQPCVHGTVLTWLPPPVAEADPVLFAEAARYFANAPCSSANRHYLTAVLQFMTPDAVRRVMALDETDRSTLSSVLSHGLRDVRSWGGRKSKHHSRATADADSTSADRLSSTHPTTTIKPRVSRLQKLADRLGIVHAVPPPRLPAENEPIYSQQRQRKDCISRHGGHCPVSGNAAHTDETSHIISQSVSTVRRHDPASLFWFLLCIIYGEAIRDQLFTIFGGSLTFSPANALFLTATLHRIYDRGGFWLRPFVEGRAERIPADATIYDVELHWMDPSGDLSSHYYATPEQPQDQVQQVDGKYVLAPLMDHARRLRSGDKFRLFTNNVEMQPLPHPMLLELRFQLWAMIYNCGLGATVQEKKRKEREDDWQDDDDDDDDDDFTRPQARRRKTRDLKRPGSKHPPPTSHGKGNEKNSGSSAGGESAAAPASKAAKVTTIELSSPASSVFEDPDPDPRKDPWLVRQANEHARILEKHQQATVKHYDSYSSSGSDTESDWDNESSASSSSDTGSEDGDDGYDPHQDPWLREQAARRA